MLSYQFLNTHSHSKPVKVLIHGLFGSKENLNVIAKFLANEFNVLNIDVRNHGDSFHSDEISYEIMANDVVELLDNLNLKNVDLIGHSMGGKIAMQIALNHAYLVNKLIVLDIAPTNYKPRHDDVFSGLLAVDLATIDTRKDADNIMANHIQETGVRQFLLKSLTKTDSGFMWKFNLNALHTHYNAILMKPSGTPFSGPTLFIKGANSEYIDATHRAEILALFPNSKAKVLAGCGHWLHAEKPDQVNLSITQFLNA